jgi:hypothetical protein
MNRHDEVPNKKEAVIMIMMTGGGGTVVPTDEVAWLAFLNV